MSVIEQWRRVAGHISDDELLDALRGMKRVAELSTRTRRELALLQVRCLRHEMARRGLRATDPPAGPEGRA